MPPKATSPPRIAASEPEVPNAVIPDISLIALGGAEKLVQLVLEKRYTAQKRQLRSLFRLSSFKNLTIHRHELGFLLIRYSDRSEHKQATV